MSMPMNIMPAETFVSMEVFFAHISTIAPLISKKRELSIANGAARASGRPPLFTHHKDHMPSTVANNPVWSAIHERHPDYPQ